MSGALAALSGSGGIGGTVSLANKNPSISVPFGTAPAIYALNADGFVYVMNTINDQYATPVAIAPFLECRMTVNSGPALSGSASGSWLALSSTQTWTLSNSNAGTLVETVATIEIREAGTGIVRASATITFDAEVL